MVDADGQPRRNVLRRHAPGLAACAVACLAAALIYPPWTPWIVTRTDVDAGWLSAIPYLKLMGLSFGDQTLFTYGPLGYVMHGYHPATYPTQVVVWILFACGMALVLFDVLRGTGLRRFAAAAWCVVLLTVLRVRGQDSILLLPSWIVPALWFFGEGKRHRRAAIGAGVLMGVAALCKSSYLLIGVCVVPILVDAVVRRARPWPVVSFLATVVGVWVASGQSAGKLPLFVARSFDMGFGYGQAMRMDRPFKAELMGMYLASAGMLLGAIGLHSWNQFRWRGLIATFACALWLECVFKSGFIRHPGVHLLPGATVAVLFACALLWRDARGWAVRWMLILSAVGMTVALDRGSAWRAQRRLTEAMGRTWTEQVPEAVCSIGRLLSDGWDASRADWETARAALRESEPLPKVIGTVDIYPNAQGALLAWDLDWHPRPVFQSYAAYTPSMLKLNADHLSSEAAARTVLFGLGTVDDRYPSLDDGLSWPVLLSRYDLRGEAFRKLVFVRAVVPRAFSIGEPVKLNGKLGQWLDLSAHPFDLTWATLRMTRTAAGALLTAVYAEPDVFIEVKLDSGEVRRFRMIPIMARAGFLLSPLVRTRDDFAAVANGSPDARSKVTAVRLFQDPDEKINAFAEEFSMTLADLKLPERGAP